LDAFKVPGSVFDTAIADHGVHAQNHVIRPYVLATRAWRHDDEINSTSNPAIVCFSFFLIQHFMDYALRTCLYYFNASLQCFTAADFLSSCSTFTYLV
jgi:hypothetical protein